MDNASHQGHVLFKARHVSLPLEMKACCVDSDDVPSVSCCCCCKISMFVVGEVIVTSHMFILQVHVTVCTCVV